jgi:DNA replication protein DnaC
VTIGSWFGSFLIFQGLRRCSLSWAGRACAWVKGDHPLCLSGETGTGKSHLLLGLGNAAAETGYRVRYTLASKW